MHDFPEYEPLLEESWGRQSHTEIYVPALKMPHKAGEVTQTNTRRSHTDIHQLNINPEGFGEATQSNARYVGKVTQTYT